MGFEVAPGTCDVAQLAYDKLWEVCGFLMMNINESFALLVDSRLRAHAKFLAMHGLSVAEKKFEGVGVLDQKLQRLLEIGNLVTASKTKVEVEVVDADENDERGMRSTSSISFQVTMNLSIESIDGIPSSSFTISFEALGSLGGAFHQHETDLL